MYGELEEGGPWYMYIMLSVKLFGVVVFYTSMVNWSGGHSDICKTYLV